jgi:glycosyltransferase involved in cell wall biosynthesis
LRTLVAIPVFNEESTVVGVVERVLQHASDVLLIDDGSTDGTADVLGSLGDRPGLHLVRHEGNLGYGRSLIDAFRWAAERGYSWVISMDCDEQHEPAEIPAFMSLIAEDRWDIISGSRYLDAGPEANGAAPPDRRRINGLVTAELNERLGLSLTDGFCGFKAHRVRTLAGLRLTEAGYAFPMQLWVQLVASGARIREHPVRLIYNDPNRSFGGGLDDHEARLTHYREVLHSEICAHACRLPAGAADGLVVPCS